MIHECHDLRGRRDDRARRSLRRGFSSRGVSLSCDNQAMASLRDPLSWRSIGAQRYREGRGCTILLVSRRGLPEGEGGKGSPVERSRLPCCRLARRGRSWGFAAAREAVDCCRSHPSRYNCRLPAAPEELLWRNQRVRCAEMRCPVRREGASAAGSDNTCRAPSLAGMLPDRKIG